jgi:hypothetical protein
VILTDNLADADNRWASQDGIALASRGRRGTTVVRSCGVLASAMETRAFSIKLKPNSIDRVRAWAEEIMRRKEEALETLRDEGVVLECFFLDRRDDGDYLISIMAAQDFERSQTVVRTSTHAIDAFHQAFKRATWESEGVLEGLVELTSLDVTPPR